jgi:hypothetical protein
MEGGSNHFFGALCADLWGTVEKFGRPGDAVQDEFPALDWRGAALVCAAAYGHYGHLSAHGPYRHMDEVAGDFSDRGQSIYSIAFHRHILEEPDAALGIHPHRQTGFHAVAADQHAVPDFFSENREIADGQKLTSPS